MELLRWPLDFRDEEVLDIKRKVNNCEWLVLHSGAPDDLIPICQLASTLILWVRTNQNVYNVLINHESLVLSFSSAQNNSQNDSKNCKHNQKNEEAYPPHLTIPARMQDSFHRVLKAVVILVASSKSHVTRRTLS